jgi:hypothetical protein
MELVVVPMDLVLSEFVDPVSPGPAQQLFEFVGQAPLVARLFDRRTVVFDHPHSPDFLPVGRDYMFLPVVVGEPSVHGVPVYPRCS